MAVQRQEEAFRRRSTVPPSPLSPARISAICFPPRPRLDERIQYSTPGDRFKRAHFSDRGMDRLLLVGGNDRILDPDESLLPRFGIVLEENDND